MAILLRKYFWTLNLVVIAICSLLAAHGVGQVVMAQLPEVKRTTRSASQPRVGMEMFKPPDVAHVVQRNIFCSTCEPEPTALEAEVAETGEAPATSTLDMTLIATLVSPVDEDYSYAAIRDPADEHTRMYGIGSHLPGEAVVAGIEDRRVIVERDGRAEVLELGADEGGKEQGKARVSRKTRMKTPRPRPGMEGLAKAIRKVGPTRWEIERSALNKVLSNPTSIARSARIVPAVKNGKPSGFKLYAIRRGSLYSLLGMFNGDTVNAINGHAITTPDKALQIYTRLRSASHLSISFTRRGKQLTHEYVIR